MSDKLIVIDMQNDFIDGALANPVAAAIVKPIAKFMERFWGDIWATKDTHDDGYMETQEGKWLPIPHCLDYTDGQEICKEILDTGLVGISNTINKKTFGIDYFQHFKLNVKPEDSIYLCGTCTDICVITNAFLLKTYYPENKIYIIADLCAGTTPENHQRALDIMNQCQMGIINAEDVN